jgi:hypothetical protein
VESTEVLATYWLRDTQLKENAHRYRVSNGVQIMATLRSLSQGWEPDLGKLRYQLHKIRFAAVITGLPVRAMVMSAALLPVELN